MANIVVRDHRDHAAPATLVTLAHGVVLLLQSRVFRMVNIVVLVLVDLAAMRTVIQAHGNVVLRQP